MDIETFREYYIENCIYITNHASERLRQHNIKMKDIKSGIMNGKIIEEYPNDFPFPSCLILGSTNNNTPIHIVLSDEDTASRIITAYIPSEEKWENDLMTRKEMQL